MLHALLTLDRIVYRQSMKKSVTAIVIGMFITNFAIGQVRDAEGNVYQTVKIGNQLWMAENLRTSKFCNGDAVAYVEDEDKWRYTKEAAWCYQDNDPKLGEEYGKIYNWHTVSDERNICPCGWKVPNESDWDALAQALGGNAVAGSKMKTVGSMEEKTGVWHDMNESATNESGFNGVPGGGRDGVGGFLKPGFAGGWWSSTPASDDAAYGRGLAGGAGNLLRDSEHKNSGFSIRCVKE